MSQPERHAYGEHPSQVCELFAPAGEGPFSVAVLIHGGFWRQRYGRDLQWRIAGNLVARGWAAWNVEYRRLGGDGGWPATLADVAEAVDALASHDERLDLGRTVAIGHSAGGQLALWAAARSGLPDGTPGAGPRVRVGRAVAQAGVIDLRAASRLRSSDAVVHELLGGTPAEVPERYALASPAERLPIGVPMLLVHGEDDGNVPVAVSRDFAAAAVAAGDACELAVVPGEGHYEHLQPGSRCWEAVLGWLG